MLLTSRWQKLPPRHTVSGIRLGDHWLPVSGVRCVAPLSSTAPSSYAKTKVDHKRKKTQPFQAYNHGKMVLLRQQNYGQQMKFLLLQPKILPQQPNVLLIEPNILLLQQNIFAIPILTYDFVGITKPFFLRDGNRAVNYSGICTIPSLIRLKQIFCLRGPSGSNMAIGLRPCRNSGSKPRPIRGWLGCPDPTQIAAITRWPQSTSADPEGPPWAGRDKFLPGRAGGGQTHMGRKTSHNGTETDRFSRWKGRTEGSRREGGRCLPSRSFCLLFLTLIAPEKGRKKRTKRKVEASEDCLQL